MGKAYEGISRLKVMDGHRAQGMTMAEGERGWDIKERINKWDLIKIKSFCMAKATRIKIK